MIVARAVAILISAWLPVLAAILPLGRFHTTHALIIGAVATVLALGSLSDDRLRFAAAAVGGWVVLSPFIFASTLIEKALMVSWGVVTIICMIGPLGRPRERAQL
jgi:hypothetical protein